MFNKVVICIVLVALVVLSTGCASIFYSDRMQNPGSRLDVGMFVLDIFFFWPISWIVDFATGAIWAPY